MDSKTNQKFSASSEISEMTTGNWFYFHSGALTASQIVHAVTELYPDASAELWSEAGVIELTLASKVCVDFEQIPPQFSDEEGTQFLQEHKIQTLFQVSFSPEAASNVLPCFEQLSHTLGGFFCADTPGLLPRIPSGF